MTTSIPPDPITARARTATDILHVDLDAFYASVEQLADPALAGRPVIVGGLGPRGVVAAASYEAREFGVHSAMPMSRARRACANGVFLAPRFDAYEAASRTVMAILHSFTPLVEPIASDEAFLDVAGARRLHGTGPECARAIRHRVRGETGLTASVGVATTKLVAKLASDSSKPDGLLVIEPGDALAYLHALPVQRLWGVGPATRRRLADLGVRTVGELALVPERVLVEAVGDAHGRHLHGLAWNRDERAVVPGRSVKSVGNEETFPVDLHDRAALGVELVRLADRVAGRLRAGGHAGRTVQLKVRYADFRTITRSRTLRSPTDVAADLARVARDLLDALPLGDGVRLLGVSAHQLVDVVGETYTTQGGLFADAEHAAAAEPRSAWHVDGRADPQLRAALERSVDEIRSRFGAGAVGPASTRVGRPVSTRDNGKP